MIVQFETKSQRVKGLSFHPTRPWILASLHTGSIQLWDYHIGSLVEKFEQHEGPVRGIHFHPMQPLFVSGGDDYKIKVWNYKTRKSVFTLKGHLDYIRTVFFHHELPWILSSSDDQTIRLWNWQSRSIIAILTGHSHYVMCSQFHPSQDLIISCSLDQTLRLWDFSALRKKFMQKGPGGRTDMYSGNEVEIIAMLDGHERGINWCTFHPTENLIISGADDRKIKIWKYTETKAWEHDSLYGHTSNVSSCGFLPKLDIIISNGEDKTTRVWDKSRRTLLEVFKRENERFWAIAVHPEKGIFASGADNGLFIISLFRERIPMVIGDNNNFFYSDRKNLKQYNFPSKTDITLKNFEGNSSSSSTSKNFTDNIATLTYNNFETTSKHSFLIGIDDKDSSKPSNFVLVTYDSQKLENLRNSKESSKAFSGYGATFISKNKIARIRDSKDVTVYHMELESSEQVLPGLSQVEQLFSGTIGKIIAVTDDQLILYDVSNKQISASLPLTSEFTNVKLVEWNKSQSFLAIACKKYLHVFTKNLQKVCTISQKFNIKSVYWTPNSNILLYTTINHIKYALLNGESGILRCVDSRLKIVQVQTSQTNNVEATDLYVIDSECKIQALRIDPEEFLIKQALFEKNWERIKYFLQHHKKLGNSIISYLYRKNYSGLALKLVDDKRAQFSLAINSGNLQVAYKSCAEIKDQNFFIQLGEEALRQGNHQLVEYALQNTREYEKLSFQYLVTGQYDKLKKMVVIAKQRADVMSRFQNSLWIGNVTERIELLAEIGQYQLAYLLASTHNITNYAEQLKETLEASDKLTLKVSPDRLKRAEALVPPTPLIIDIESSPQSKRNWPHNFIPEESLIATQENEAQNIEELKENNENELVHDDRAGLNENQLGQGGASQTTSAVADLQVTMEGDGAEEPLWGNQDIDLPETQEPESSKSAASVPVNPSGEAVQPGENLVVKAVRNSNHPGDNAALGFFEQTIQNLKKQLGIVVFAPFKENILRVSNSSFYNITGIPFIQPISQAITTDEKSNRPYLAITVASATNYLKAGYKFTTEGKFAEAEEQFRKVLYAIPFISIQTDQEEKDVDALLRISLEYLVGLGCELAQQRLPGGNEPQRQLELSGYMSICNMQAPHRVLALRAAMSQAYKLQNFITSAHFAKKLIRLLEANPNAAKPDVLANARKVQQSCEQQGTNELKIDFQEEWLDDEDAALKINTTNFTIMQHKDFIQCPFCQVVASQEKENTICTVCQVGKLGLQVLGLKQQ